jgi:membrane protease subunit HflK
MERVFGGMDKVILDQNGSGSGVVPYLPLGELGQQQQRRPAGQTQGAVR